MNLLQDRPSARSPPRRNTVFAVSACVATALAQFVLAPAASAASLSAETRICVGFTGSASNPQLACAPGSSGGGGTAIIGGSGVGSGINVPFQSDGFGTEVSASAAVLQDYGVFRGYAHYHKIDQHPDLFGGSYGANAWGSYEDTWTILGGNGQGRLQLTYTVTGDVSADLFVAGGKGTESAGGSLNISVSVDSVTGGALSLQTGGTYPILPGGPDALLFTFGVPFKLGVIHGLSVGGGYDRLDPPDFFQLDAHASFEHTAILSGVAITDRFGNPITNFSITAESGTQYPLAVGAVPLPAAMLSFASAFAALSLVRRRPFMRAGAIG